MCPPVAAGRPDQQLCCWLDRAHGCTAPGHGVRDVAPVGWRAPSHAEPGRCHSALMSNRKCSPNPPASEPMQSATVQSISAPGTFSANDSIFAALESQRFRGGPCTAPGRVIPEMQAIWVAGQPDPHRGHPTFRQARGNLNSANMPLSADFSRVLNGPANRNLYADFRPDVDRPGQYQVSYQTIATNVVRQVRERAPTVPVLSTITHNHYA
jgi:hypothetical protein